MTTLPTRLVCAALSVAGAAGLLAFSIPTPGTRSDADRAPTLTAVVVAAPAPLARHG